MNVPFFSYDLAPKNLKHEWLEVIESEISIGKFIKGQSVHNFENSWASALGAKKAVGVGNGLDGLTLALRALGLGHGARVALPAHTFIATWLAVHNVGAIPIGIDVDESGQLDLDELFLMSPIPDAVIPVHMHGNILNMHRLITWATEHSVKVIEDASQAHLLVKDGKHAGTWGDCGVFSLYPTKNLGSLGDAGIIVSNDLDLIERISVLANYGSDPDDKYSHSQLGYNSRMDTIQAAVLNVNLKYLLEWNSQRAVIGMMYRNFMNQLGITHLHSEFNSVFHHFVILSNNRGSLQNFLRLQGVDTEVHYPNLAAHEYASLTFGKKYDYTGAEKIANCGLSLPISQWHSVAQIEFVLEIIGIAHKKDLITFDWLND